MRGFFAGILALLLLIGCHKAPSNTPAQAPVQGANPTQEAANVKELEGLNKLLPGKWRQITETGVGFGMMKDPNVTFEFKSDGTGTAYGNPMTWKCVKEGYADPELVITQGTKVGSFTIFTIKNQMTLSAANFNPTSYIKEPGTE